MVHNYWHRETVVLMFKKGSRCLAGKYKPVSLTSLVRNAFGEMVRYYIQEFFCVKHIISNGLGSSIS